MKLENLLKIVNCKLKIVKLYRWLTATRLRKFLSGTLAILIVLTSIRFLFLPATEVSADSTLGFDEGYGSTTKDLNNTLTGTITNAVWKAEEFCKVGKCLYFDGTGDLVNFGNDSDVTFTTGSFTITGWFRTPDITSGQRTLVAKHNATAGGYKVYIDSNGYLIFGIDPDSTWSPSDTASSSTTALDDNKWHHFVAVKNGTTSISLYVDGNLMQTDSSITASSLTNSDTFYIGMDGNGSSNGFSGFLDEIKVYAGTARTEAEIKADYLGETPSRGVTASFGSDNSWISNGLVGYWKMDETSWSNANCTVTKSILDSSGNSNDGSSCPTSTGPTTPAAGKFGNAGVFDGTDEYLDVDQNFKNTLSSFSTSYWVYVNSLDGSANHQYRPYDRLNGESSYPRMSIVGDGRISLQLKISGTTEQTLTTSPNVITAGTWYHIGATYDNNANVSKIFINGVEAKSFNNTPGTLDGSTNHMRMGFQGTATNYLNGKLDDFRVYNRALSPAEVAKLYNFAPGPVGYWNFDENTGITTAYDKSGNGSNATFGQGSSETAITYDPWVPGKFGSAARFTGGDNGSVAVVGTPAVLAELPHLSLSAWVRSINASSDNDRIIDRTASGVGGWNFYITSQEELSFIVDYSGTNNLVVESPVITNLQNTWHHVAVTWDGTANASGVHLYIDGVEATPYSTATNGDGSRVVEGVNSWIGIGRRVHSNNRGFFGTIDDVRIYNYARTPGQIIEDMNGGHPAPGSPIGSAVAHWEFDEGYGTTAYDNSINGNNLTLSTASWTNSGKFGKAFNGLTNVRLSRTTDPDLEFSATDDFTLSLWYKSDSANNPAATEYLMASGGPAGSAGYAIYANTDGTVCFGIDDDTSWGPDVASCTPTDVYDNTWHHITAVRNVTLDTTKIYLDAVEKDSDTDTTTATLDSSPTFYIGDANATDGTDEFLGDIDEVKIFRSALTSDAIKVLYNQSSGTSMGSLSTNSSGVANNSDTDSYCPPGQGSTCVPPIVHFKLDENTGTTSVFDSSTNNFTGTMFGSKTNSDWVSGKFGSGLKFDGVNDGVDFYSAGFNSLFSPTSGTLSLWWRYPNSSQWSAGGTPNAINIAADTNNLVTIRRNTTNIQFLYNAGGTIEEFQITTQPTNWVHLTMTWDKAADKVEYYYNGIYQQTDTTLGTWAGALDSIRVVFGARTTAAADPFDGQLDNIQVYNYARTPAQIAWDYNRGAPVGWWEMDETSWNGTASEVKDSSGNVMHGVRTGNATTTTGKLNNAGTFDGAGDYVTVTDTANLDSNLKNFSLSFWTYINVQSDYDFMVSKQLGDSSDGGYRFMLDNTSPNHKLAFGVKSDTGSNAVNSDNTLSSSTWYHVTGTWDGSNLRLYINGSQQSSTPALTGSNVKDTAHNLSFGDAADHAGGNYLNGLVDDVRIYNYALTPQQIKLIMNDNSAVRFAPVTGSP